MKWADVPWIIEVRGIGSRGTPPRVVARAESADLARAAAAGISDQLHTQLVTCRHAEKHRLGNASVVYGYRNGARLTLECLRILLDVRSTP